MRLKPSSVLLSSLLLLGSACIVEAPGGASPEERRAATVSQVPPLSVRNGANLGGKVELVGATVQPGRLTPGEQAKVTVYFKVLQPLEDDYLVFVHVEDVDGRMDRMNVDHQPAGGLYPTSKWRPGETVKDEFTLYLPPGAPARALNIWLGLWEPRTDSRLRLTNPQAVRNDGRDRVFLAQVPVAR
ncbi:hypothetical protein [Myxococcus sp. RHSTA-1-4]|uniref:hypothetical protein n=1 Tax=Myxococcus sp. RHSTA-1-4 TaxID=2874601 RepID=UPI001CC04A84|nr:hypothetical protein [Myxococcus sp. RHSTA-1-4]MBZ4419621.1 hypothetical protein [Myxococcus sp. RHSTA-1-4]